MSYRLTAGQAIIRLADGAYIPVTEAGGCIAADQDGADGRALAAWLAAGNRPETAVPMPTMPKSLSDGNLAAVLVKKGVLAQADVDSAIAADGLK